MNKPTVVIMRGPSGSGKSTWITQNFMGRASYTVCSADDYFRTSGGGYEFVPELLSEAHLFCKWTFARVIKSELKYVFVDNTNTRLWEFLPYLNEAEKNGNPVLVVRLKTTFQNDKGVPQEVVDRQRERMEDWPGELVLGG